MTVADVIMLSARALLAVVLVAAGAAKLADLRAFAGTLQRLNLPGRRRRFAAASLVAGAELGLGTLSLAAVWPRVIDAVVLGVMIAFVVVTTVSVIRRTDVRCRCFGALSDSRFDAHALARALFLCALAAAIVAGAPTLPAEAWPHPVGPVAAVVAATVLLAFGCGHASRTVDLVRRGAAQR